MPLQPRLANLVGLAVLSVVDASNSCSDYDGIGRTACVAQGVLCDSVSCTSCEWCGTYWGGTKCSNSAWAGPCSSGWKSTPAPPPTCDDYTFDSTPGSLTDGSGSSDYDNNRDCAWKLECPSGQHVQLSFSSFDTEHNYDFVTVYDGESASSAQLGRFSGSSRPSTTTSSGRYMRVRFTTDGSVTNSGWSASWSCTSPPPPTCDSYTFDSTPGSLTDGSGSSDYTNNIDCAWKLECPSGLNVQLSFSSFDTESCCDHVTVYDGESESADQLGRFSGSSRPSLATSSGHRMRVRFTTDGSVTNSGWSASWSCTSPPPPTCDSYTVSGAAQANGVYARTTISSYYGPDTYTKGQLAIFRWARQHWVISDLGPGMDDFSEDRWLFKVASSADSPPQDGWTVGARGTAPAPNVWSCTSPCAGVDCAHGTCDNALAACVCDRFYFGDKCEERDTCRGVECGSHGSCVQASDDRPGACSCEDGWSGEHCETQDLCFGVECGAHGLCDVSSGQCDCEDGWGGDRCDTISAAASCDGSGGLTLAHRDPGSDPSCNENCNHCSAEQVLAAMAAAPTDYQIQKNGLYALGHQAHGDVASGATIADAGGIGAVIGAMAQFPGDEYVQSDGCFALASLANDSPANQAAIAAAGGAETVEGAMARLSNKDWVQRWCQTALDALAVASCTHECGAHGTCADGQCVCDAGWSGDHCESLAFGATLSGAALGGKQAAVGFCGLGLVGAAVAVRRRMLAGDEAGTLAAPLASAV